MSLKLIFLGAGSALDSSPQNYQSNLLLELNHEHLLIDAGTDVKFSLREQGMDYMNIKNIYITHLHSDHCGGLEWLALASYFNPKYQDKPTLYASEKLLPDLWNKTLAGGLSTLPQTQASLDTYFHVKPVKSNEGFVWNSIHFQLVQTIHYYNGYELMPSFGLIFNYNKTRIFFTSDTQKSPTQLLSFYQESDIIFQDCETSEHKSGVHAHYTDLLELPQHIRNKMWLYHYNDGKLPDALADGFLGFVTKGQQFLF